MKKFLTLIGSAFTTRPCLEGDLVRLMETEYRSEFRQLTKANGQRPDECQAKAFLTNRL